ncbi:MAG TPA: GntR family transcriptional regulator [Gaiellaceae bacterium]|jgi:DNA-binding GntR family transcriptional regulator
MALPGTPVDAVEERRALVDKLAATLQARVLNGELPMGARLRQAALAEEFGVSRTPVREALRKLQASGLVELRPNRGALVRGLSSREVRDAYEVRAELEGLAAELAALHVHHEHVDRLRQAQEQFRAALADAVAARDAGAEPSRDVSDRWGRANDLFHQAIQEAAGNDVLAATLAHLHRSFPRDLTRTVLRESTMLLNENVHEHETILAAIERRDPAAARELMVAHVRRAGSLVTRRLDRRS